MSALPGEAVDSSVEAVRRPTVVAVVLSQRKVVAVALALIAASLWLLSQLDSWLTALCAAGGIALGLLNHLFTEYWLGTVIASGATPTRGSLTRSTFLRLSVIAAFAIFVAFTFRPEGIALLFGLAIFRLISLVMTGIPLLKELRDA